MDFPECFHLQSFGMFALLSRCEATKVGLNAAWTSCGYQPVVANSRRRTIESDGKTMAPFTNESCFHRNSIGNLDGVPFQYKNGPWVEMSPSQRLRHLAANVTFDLEVDTSEENITAGFVRNPAEIYSILGD